MDEKKGLYGKYKIEKTDGTPIDPNADYFILRLDTDPAARIAAAAYADAIEASNSELADQLRARIEAHFTYAAKLSERDLSHANLFIWWIDSNTIRALNEDCIGGSLKFPDYVRDELSSMSGRPLRGRLWVPSEIDLVQVDWISEDDSSFDRFGGLVFHRDELGFVQRVQTGFVSGFVTDVPTGKRL